MEEKIKVRDKEYTIKELKYKDVSSMKDLPQEEAAKRLLILSTNMTDEEYDNLSMREGLEIQKAINKLNGLEDFRVPQDKQQQN